LGGSIRGKHLTFRPRVQEALQLHTQADLHAMIDISDGLAADVEHLVIESHCGAVLRAEAIPLTHEARTMNDARTPLEHGLSDGEDFELVLAVSAPDAQRLLETQPIPGIQLSYIGECLEQGLWLEEDGRRRVLEARGYVHPLSGNK
jgi:thiamine-monophosphate kinase